MIPKVIVNIHFVGAYRSRLHQRQEIPLYRSAENEWQGWGQNHLVPHDWSRFKRRPSGNEIKTTKMRASSIIYRDEITDGAYF